MDKYDRKLIHCLTEDARISWTRLSELVSLSASACQRRVEGLVEAGVIERFTVQLNNQQVGNTVQAFIAVNVERQNTEQAEALRQRLLDHQQVQSAHMVSGSIDFMLLVVAQDLAGLAHFLDEDLLQIPGVRDATSSIVLKSVKSHQAVLGLA